MRAIQLKSFAFKEDKYTLTQTSQVVDTQKLTISPPLEGIIKVPAVGDDPQKQALERINTRYTQMRQVAEMGTQFDYSKNVTPQ